MTQYSSAYQQSVTVTVTGFQVWYEHNGSWQKDKELIPLNLPTACRLILCASRIPQVADYGTHAHTRTAINTCHFKWEWNPVTKKRSLLLPASFCHVTLTAAAKQLLLDRRPRGSRRPDSDLTWRSEGGCERWGDYRKRQTRQQGTNHAE
jgi:hypothetical protein